jgi:hypothetical protein
MTKMLMVLAAMTNRLVTGPIRKILVIVVIFFLVGCTAPSNDLVGSWKYADDGNSNSSIDLSLLNDGTYIESIAIPAYDMGGTYRGNYTIKGSELTLSPIDIEADDPSIWGSNPITYQFILDKEQLTLTSGDQALIFTKYSEP